MSELILILKRYQDVPVTAEGISTSEFIDATEGVVKLFDLLGSSAFAVVQNDMNGNIKVCYVVTNMNSSF